MASPVFDRERAIRILLDAHDMGDAQACARHKIALRTLQSYRQRLAGDPELAAACALKKAELDESWKRDRIEALREGVRTLTRLFKEATLKEMRDVTGAVKVLGELDLVGGVLSDDKQPGADPESEPSEGPEGPEENGEPPFH